MKEVSGSPYTVGSIPQYIAASPNAACLFVSNVMDKTVSAFKITPGTGVLTAVTSSPISVRYTPASLTVDPSGKFLTIALISGSGLVGVYSVDSSTCGLTAVSGSPFALQGYTPNNIVIDASSKFVYVSETGGSGSVETLSLNNATGTLTQETVDTISGIN